VWHGQRLLTHEKQVPYQTLPNTRSAFDAPIAAVLSHPDLVKLSYKCFYYKNLPDTLAPDWTRDTSACPELGSIEPQ